jgi:hypothetical protein
VGPDQLLFVIAVLIAVELNHLKWIWWTYWKCAKHARPHCECGCRAKWLLYL